MVRQEIEAWWATRVVEIVWELILPGASAALMLYGGMRVLDGRLSLGDLMMFLVYLAMLLEPIAVLASSIWHCTPFGKRTHTGMPQSRSGSPDEPSGR